MVAGQLALMAAALFTGAAAFVSAVEQPARLGLDDRAALAEWKPSYARGAMMQAPLALIGCVLGLVAWWQSGDWRWTLGALVLVANWPFTLVVIKPTNDALNATDAARAGPGSRELIERWGRLHAGRTALGAVATLLYLWASLAA